MVLLRPHVAMTDIWLSVIILFPFVAPAADCNTSSYIPVAVAAEADKTDADVQESLDAVNACTEHRRINSAQIKYGSVSSYAAG
jgi:hypothetical protein